MSRDAAGRDGKEPAADDPQAGRHEPRASRPWLERIGLAAVAMLMTCLFGVVAAASLAGGEWILAAMSAVGALMTFVVGVVTVLRG